MELYSLVLYWPLVLAAANNGSVFLRQIWVLKRKLSWSLNVRTSKALVSCFSIQNTDWPSLRSLGEQDTPGIEGSIAGACSDSTSSSNQSSAKHNWGYCVASNLLKTPCQCSLNIICQSFKIKRYILWGDNTYLSKGAKSPAYKCCCFCAPCNKYFIGSSDSSDSLYS